jgi:hypothetical protein
MKKTKVTKTTKKTKNKIKNFDEIQEAFLAGKKIGMELAIDKIIYTQNQVLPEMFRKIVKRLNIDLEIKEK